MKSRSIYKVLVTMLINVCWINNGSIRKFWIFADEIDHVHSKATYATLQPEVKNFMHSSSDIRILPIEIWLLWSEEREVIFFTFRAPVPSTVLITQNLCPI